METIFIDAVLRPKFSDIFIEYNQFIIDCLESIKLRNLHVKQHVRHIDGPYSELIIVTSADPKLSDKEFVVIISDHHINYSEIADVNAQSQINSAKRIYEVIIGSVPNDTWDRAFQRLQSNLDMIEMKLRTHTV